MLAHEMDVMTDLMCDLVAGPAFFIIYCTSCICAPSAVLLSGLTGYGYQFVSEHLKEPQPVKDAKIITITVIIPFNVWFPIALKLESLPCCGGLVLRLRGNDLKGFLEFCCVVYATQGKLSGQGLEHTLPTIALVAHYDAFGLATVSKSSPTHTHTDCAQSCSPCVDCCVTQASCLSSSLPSLSLVVTTPMGVEWWLCWS